MTFKIFSVPLTSWIKSLNFIIRRAIWTNVPDYLISLNDYLIAKYEHAGCYLSKFILSNLITFIHKLIKFSLQRMAGLVGLSIKFR